MGLRANPGFLKEQIGEANGLNTITKTRLKNYMTPKYTEKQGQYSSFIYYYTKINGIPPAEADMQRYSKVSPPSVHQMVVTLENRKLIKKIPGQARSIHLLLTREELPELE